jgi:hypothetical protein
MVLVLPAVPASLAAGSPAPTVSIFYYPWYGTFAKDGSYAHWSQNGHIPPNDIAAGYYPANGVYSSSDRQVVDLQMAEISSAGVDQIVVSWWGRGSPENHRLPLVLSAAHAHGLAVAVHVEPYTGRTVSSVVVDVAYLERLGIKTFFVYRPFDSPVADWAAARPQLVADGATLYAETPLAGTAAAAGFEGVYTYDIVNFGGRMFQRFCDEAHRLQLVCLPSVGPGFDARRATGDPRVKPRRDGYTYDAMWRAAIGVHPDGVTITSFNEWHEGTQIEPAAPPMAHAGYRYGSYEGAWGLHGVAAENAYLTRTGYWADVFRKTSLLQLKTKHP